MVAIPNVQITVANGGINNFADSPANTVTVYGTSSGGTANTIGGPYYRSDNLITEFGWGPGSELVAQLIASKVKVYFVKVATDTPGDASAVTPGGSNVGTSVLTLTGDPFDAYDAIITCVKAGTPGSNPEPTFTISLDGGQTVSKAITMPANRIYAGEAASTGLTLNFTAAAMAAGDTYTFTTTPPLWAAADVATAIDTFRATTKEAALGYVVGACTKAEADTITTAVNAYDDAHRYVRFILEARDFDGDTEAQWMTSISNDFQTFQSDRVSVAAGPALIPSALTQIQYRRNIGQLAIVRAGMVSVGTDLARVKNGALLPNANGQPISVVYHDESLAEGLNDNRFMTVRSFRGKIGYYITNPLVMCGPGSDYELLQFGRVVDEVCRISDLFFTEELSEGVQVNEKGFIRATIANTLESGNNSACNAAVVNTSDATKVVTTVSRTDNIIADKTLSVSVDVTPLGYIKTAAITVTLVNPANALAA